MKGRREERGEERGGRGGERRKGRREEEGEERGERGGEG